MSLPGCTKKTYMQKVEVWKTFCNNWGCDDILRNELEAPDVAASFVIHLHNMGQSIGVITTTKCAVSFWHAIHNARNPFKDAPMARYVSKAIRRLAPPTKKKRPICIEEMKMVVQWIWHHSGLTDKRHILCAVFFGFLGLLRVSESAIQSPSKEVEWIAEKRELPWHQLEFGTNWVDVNIRYRKNDVRV